MTGADFKRAAPHWLTGAYRTVAMALLVFLANELWTGQKEDRDADSKQIEALSKVAERVSILEITSAEDHDAITKGRAARYEFQALVGERLARIETGQGTIQQDVQALKADVSSIRTLLQQRADTLDQRRTFIGASPLKAD